MCKKEENLVNEEKREGQGHTCDHTHLRTLPQNTDSVLSESLSLCGKRIGLCNGPLAISFTSLNKPLSSTRPVSFV